MTAAVKIREQSARVDAPVNARDLMEKLNADAGKLNIWFILGAWLTYPIVLFVLEFLIIKKVPALTKDGRIYAVVIFILIAFVTWGLVRFFTSMMTVGGESWASNKTYSIGIGGAYGVLMMLNVWGIIWPNNKRILAATAGTGPAAAPELARDGNETLAGQSPRKVDRDLTRVIYPTAPRGSLKIRHRQPVPAADGFLNVGNSNLCLGLNRRQGVDQRGHLPLERLEAPIEVGDLFAPERVDPRRRLALRHEIAFSSGGVGRDLHPGKALCALRFQFVAIGRHRPSHGLSPRIIDIDNAKFKGIFSWSCCVKAAWAQRA